MEDGLHRPDERRGGAGLRPARSATLLHSSAREVTPVARPWAGSDSPDGRPGWRLMESPDFLCASGRPAWKQFEKSDMQAGPWPLAGSSGPVRRRTLGPCAGRRGPNQQCHRAVLRRCQAGTAVPCAPRPSQARPGGAVGPRRPAKPAGFGLGADSVRHAGQVALGLRPVGRSAMYRTVASGAQEPGCGTTPADSGVGQRRPAVTASECTQKHRFPTDAAGNTSVIPYVQLCVPAG